MDNYLYKENIKKIIAAGISKSMIFDYEHHPLANAYDQYFRWCNENLNDYSQQLSLRNCYFFYWDTFEANAGAATNKQNSFIRFSTGYMTRLSEKLGRERNFFQNSKFTGYHNLQKGIKENLDFLMFQSSTVFTFYHEFAHLVQQQNSNFYLSERPRESDFSFHNHVFEYDADLNGAQFVSVLIQQFYTDVLPQEMRTEKNFKRLMYMGISSIVITFLLFLNREFDSKKIKEIDTDFYTKAKTHPHTYVRITYVISHYVRNAKANGVNMDLQDTLNSIGVLCNEFFTGTDIFTNFMAGMYKHRDEINQYDFELYLAAKENISCIQHKMHLFGFR